MIIGDTGFFLGLANARDSRHEACRRALGAVREELITTWPVLTETCHLLVSRLNVNAEIAFIRAVAAGTPRIFALDETHLPRVGALLEKYRDLPMDLADASLVILAEELGTGRILSTDERDFAAYRWKNHKPFRNLLR